MIEKTRTYIHTLLRKSEGVTKTDMVYLTKGGFWLIVGQVVSLAAGLATSVVFANLLPKDTYGVYKYVLTLAGTVGAFALTGLGTAVTQAVARGFDGTLPKAFRMSLKYGVGTALITLGVAGYYFWAGNLAVAGSLIIIAIFGPLSDAGLLYGSLLSGKKNFKALTLYSSIRTIIGMLAIVSTLFLTKKIIIIVLVYFGIETLTSLVSYYFTKRAYLKNPTSDPESISYGKHLSAMNIFSMIADQADKIIVFHTFGAAALAIYSFATLIPLQIKGGLKNLFTLLLPKFSERPYDEIRTGAVDKMLRLGLVVALGTLVYIVLSPYVFKLLFPQYIDSVFYSQVFSLSLLAYVAVIPSSVLYAKRKTRLLYFANFYRAAAKIVLPILFIPLGVMGIILSRLVFEFADAGVTYVLFTKISDE